MHLGKLLLFYLTLLFNMTSAQVLNSSGAVLKVFSNVAEARIFIDSQDYGSMLNGEITINNLSLGQHQLLLLAEGYDTFVSTFELQANNSLEVTVTLGELIILTPENAAKSNLTIKSELDSGKVFINGYYYGGITNGEKRIINLNAGTHRLTVVAPDYQPYVAEVKLPEGEIVLNLNFN